MFRDPRISRARLEQRGGGEGMARGLVVLARQDLRRDVVWGTCLAQLSSRAICWDVLY